jgi:hypothetical protein
MTCVVKELTTVCFSHACAAGYRGLDDDDDDDDVYNRLPTDYNFFAVGRRFLAAFQ